MSKIEQLGELAVTDDEVAALCREIEEMAKRMNCTFVIDPHKILAFRRAQESRAALEERINELEEENKRLSDALKRICGSPDFLISSWATQALANIGPDPRMTPLRAANRRKDAR